MSPPPETLPTPPQCIADFCLIPLGTPTSSISPLIADVQRLLLRQGEGKEDSGGAEGGGKGGGGRGGREGLRFSMHSAGTTIEGSWDAVMRVIGQAHMLVHGQGVVRVQTDIRVGTRTDKSQSFEDKVEAVERLLAEDPEGNKKKDERQGETKGKVA